ncbi:MAG TPA: GNAT family N-acetyltransferase [Candidatus Nanopelagicales bacterium]|nr:GNAT family N-acetyltransferase [Candidatus Nanopelagicales bacterium]
MDDADGRVSLREITDANRDAVAALRVSQEQTHYVASVARSYVDAAENPDAQPWMRGVYVGDVPAGFVLLADGVDVAHPDFAGPYYLWRLLVDERYQGRGIGTAALDLTVAHVREHPDARTLRSSVVPGGERSPLPFYLGYGFVLTGELLDGEELIELRLRD